MKEFAAVVLDTEYATFVVHIADLNIDSSDKVYPSKKTQIAHLKVNKALIKVLSKYADFADIFSPILAVKLLKYTRINYYTIELVDDWQLPYNAINSLGPVEMKI